MAQSTQFDHRFVDEIAELEDGREIRRCLQCGICSASCPVRELVPAFNPQRVIARILLGLKSEVLSSDEIWFCARCQSCTANCRKDIKPGDIITAVRTIAIREGYRESAGARHTLAFLQDIRRHGEINEAILPLKTLGLWGTLRMLPYGLRMLIKGKAPSPFVKPVKGLREVQSLIDHFDD
jgi:succinate dehydrogenase / fumarate reductase, iron-sulfur subunit